MVSGTGEAAERIVKLFNEGNRVNTSLVIVDDSAADLQERLKDKEVSVVHISDSEWLDKKLDTAALIREKGVKLLVLDNFDKVIPDEIMETTNGEILRVTSAETAPREVVNALEAELRKPKEETNKPEEPEKGEPTLESEWADTLNIPYTPPQIPVTPPQLPPSPNGNPPENYNNGFVQPPYRTHAPYPGYYERRHHHSEGEPMPSTWLIWSILVTVFCCFIPGIIAIIFSSQVSSKYYAGDVEGARRASRMAEIWIIVSVVLGVLAATLYLPFMLIGG